MDKVMDKICEMFYDVLCEYAERDGFKSEADVQTAKAAVSGIFKIKTLETMERYEGNSFRGRSYDGMSRSYDGYSSRSSYDEGNSYRRGRGMDGRFVSRDSIKDKIAQMMDEAQSEQEKNALRMVLDKMH